MSAPSYTDAKKDQIVGNVKETAGSAVGNQSLQHEGQTQNGSGKIQEAAADITTKAQNAANEVQTSVEDAHSKLVGGGAAPSKVDAKKDQFVGSTREAAGSAVGNESLEAKGRARNNSGKIQESAAGLTGVIQSTAAQLTSAAQGAYDTLVGTSTPSEVDAKKDQYVGNTREAVGSAVGNESLETKGKSQNGAGQIQQAAATAVNYVHGVSDQIQGAVTGAYDALTGNSAGEANAKVQEKKGEAKEELS